MTQFYRFAPAFLLASALVGTGCGDDVKASHCEDMGVGRCLGAFVDKVGTTERDGSITYEFTRAEGPTCVSGSPYRTFYRPPVENTTRTLLFYLPSDGAWIPTANPVMTSKKLSSETLALAHPHPSFAADNPVLGDYHLVYVSPCDGSLYVGDKDYSSSQLSAIKAPDTQPRYYRGAQNVSASIDIATKHVPRPDRIILSGSGAGSMGAILAAFTIAKAYPDVEITMLQDGSSGIIYGDTYPDFLNTLLDSWNIFRNMPPTCSNCPEGGHLTNFIRFALTSIPNLRIGTYQSTKESAVPLFVNATPGVPKLTSELWRCGVLTEIGALASEFPDRYGAFVVDRSATSYDGLPGKFDYAVDELTFGAWLTTILDRDQAPITVSESPLGTPEDCP